MSGKLEEPLISATFRFMLLPPARFRSLWSGLGCAVLLHGAGDAFRMGPSFFTCYALLGAALVMGGRFRPLAALGGGGLERRVALPSNVMARLVQEPGAVSSRSLGAREPGGTSGDAPRPFWSRVKLWVGGGGLALSAVWWVLLFAMLFMPDPSPTLDGLFTSSSVTLVTVSLLLTVLLLVVLRSGLRGPSDPLAPDDASREPPRDQPAGAHTPPLPGKKRHLRLVRNAP